MDSLAELSRKDKLSIIKIEAEFSRRYLMDFSFFTDQSYQDARHLRFLTDKLEAVERGQIKKLMVFMPPRHGKSELCSVKFPAWVLGKNSNRRIIHTSYAASLSNSFSRRVRDLVEDKKYRVVFPSVATSKDSRAVDEWNLEGAKGGMIAAGVGGSITGFGADIFIIDDPVKNQEEAESECRRELVWDWYRSVVRTRLEPNAAQVIIMTRWHQHDLAGKILADQDDWTVINFSALARKDDPLGRQEGDPLWPQRYDAAALESIRHDSGSRVWLALFEGQPTDPEGALVKRSWIQWVDAIPPKSKLYGGVDTATSKKTSADSTSLVDVYKEPEGYLDVDDVFLEQVSVTGFAKYVSERHKQKKYRRINMEDNNAGNAMRQRVQEVGREENSHPPVVGVTVETDKVVRLCEIQPLIENGTIRFRRGNPRVAKLVDHLCNFDGRDGGDDDDVDGFIHAVNAAFKGDRDVVHVIA